MVRRYGKRHMQVLKDTKRLEDIQGTNSQFWTVRQFDERIMCRMMGLSSAQVPRCHCLVAFCVVFPCFLCL